MKNLQKISFWAVCCLWISTAEGAINSNSVFSNKESNSSSILRQISDQENIDTDVSRPAKRRKIEVYDGPNRNPLLNFTMTKAEGIQGNPTNIVWHLTEKKKPFTRNDIRRVVKERISRDMMSYNKSKFDEIINKVVQAARRIGSNRDGDDLYWKPIRNYQRYGKNFLNPIICSSEFEGWKEAAQEWKVIYYGEVEGTTCICGKEEIKYISGIINCLNGNELFPIGSRCIKKFKSENMNEDINVYKEVFNKISKGISKLRETTDKGESIKFNARLFSEELIRYLNKKGALNSSDCQFLLDTLGQRCKKSEKKEQINKIIDESIVPYIKGIPQNEMLIIDRQMLKQLKG